MRRRSRREMVIRNVDLGPDRRGVRDLHIRTNWGDIEGRLNLPDGAAQGVIMVGDTEGGFTGPASVYPELAEELAQEGIASLRLDYRHPAVLEECMPDVLAAIEALADLGVERVALIGWSFGGAVAIWAGALSDRVAAVATVASQSYGTDMVDALAPRPLLLLHGNADRTLPPGSSRDIFRRAGQPKEIEIYPGANHGLDQVRDKMRERLAHWVLACLAEPHEQRKAA